MARFTMAANATLIRQMPQAPMGVREVSPHAILFEFLYVVYEIKVLKGLLEIHEVHLGTLWSFMSKQHFDLML